MSDETTYDEFEGIGADARIGDTVIRQCEDLTVTGVVALIEDEYLHTTNGHGIAGFVDRVTIRRPVKKLPTKIGSVILVRKVLGYSFEDHPMCRTVEGFEFLVDALSGTAITYFEDEIEDWVPAKIVPEQDGE